MSLLLQATNSDATMAVVIGAGATLFAGVVTALITTWVRRRPEMNLFRAEVREAYRHYETNRKILLEMEAAIGLAMKDSNTELKERFSVLHFEKFKAPADSIFFNPDAMRLLRSKYMNKALLLKIRLRNRNLEAQRVVDYMRDGKYDLKTLLAYVKLLDAEHERVEQWMRKELGEFISDTDPSSDRKHAVLKEPEPAPHYPKVEALDIERLADLVAERLK